MSEIEQSMRKASAIAGAALDMAEKRGLTLHEVMCIPEIMENIITSEIQKKNTTYRRG